MYDSVKPVRVVIECKLMFYSSILYTILHAISTLPYCTLSYILSLLLHTAHYYTFYHYSSLLYINLHRVGIYSKIVYSMEV
jgi:hypothetical protein